MKNLNIILQFKITSRENILKLKALKELLFELTSKSLQFFTKQSEKIITCLKDHGNAKLEIMSQEKKNLSIRKENILISSLWNVKIKCIHL